MPRGMGLRLPPIATYLTRLTRSRRSSGPWRDRKLRRGPGGEKRRFRRCGIGYEEAIRSFGGHLRLKTCKNGCTGFVS
eukprot:4610194-Pyramimonas_sp.AAC.1